MNYFKDVPFFIRHGHEWEQNIINDNIFSISILKES